MGKLTYNTKLIFQNDTDKNKILLMLESQRLTWNECSSVRYSKITKNSIIELHALFYKDFRKSQPQIPSQVIISAEQSVLSAYRSIKSNKQVLKKPAEKKKLSMRLDQRSYSYKNGIFSIISLEKRVKCAPHPFPKLENLINKYRFCDPLIYVRDNEVYISLTFNIPDILSSNKLAVGVDLGTRVFAATSEGFLYVDKKFNGEKRRLRYLKRELQAQQSKKSKSAKRHLKKLRRKEANKNKNFSHHLANRIIKDTKADTIVLENLKSIKVKKHKYQNKNRISQVPMFELRRILTYKALLNEKTVIVVSPAYTSQIDHRTGNKDGIRSGGRYTGKDNQIMHADVNAACNIGLRSKLPCSINDYFAWQATVKTPIVG